MVSAICVAFLSAAIATAGTISPRLADQIASLAPDATVSVLVVMQKRIKGANLKLEIAAAAQDRGARHAAAVVRLRTIARNGQRDLLTELKRLEQNGNAADVRSYWIDNLVSVELKKAELAALAARSDVESIVPFPEVETIAPIEVEAGTSRAAGPGEAEPGLRVVGADQMWAMGYTGRGRLVANLDTGVDGLHPALGPRWRGNLGAPASAAWFDEVFGQTTPYAVGNKSHGTLSMGLICGADPLTGDTTGVAPDAEWIAAGVIDVKGANIIEALQWCADPDGDPNTVGDVPDVVSNAWGLPLHFGFACEEIFWNVIDNIEAAGAVVLWAAGNEGSNPSTIRNPANRASSSLNAFCVGMINGHDSALTVHSRSSRGPSICDTISIKPEVVAPGVETRSTMPGGGYAANFLGTSYATPHVAGAVALLRQYNPNATVDEIKMALLNSARDLGDLGPDNDYGHGLIDIPAAMALLPAPSESVVRIVREHYVRPLPGEMTSLVVVLANNGPDLDGVTLSVASLDGRLTTTANIVPLGSIADGDTASNAASPFGLAVTPDALPGERLPMRFTIRGAGGHEQVVTGFIQVAAASGDGTRYVTHDAGNAVFSIGDDGVFGLGNRSLHVRAGGVGFQHPPAAGASLYEMGFLVGTDPDHLSDNVRGGLDGVSDFRVERGGGIFMAEPGAQAAQESYSAYSDVDAAGPLGVFVQQRSYAWDDSAAADFVILAFTVHNRSGAPLRGVRAAMFSDWDFPWGASSFDWGALLANDHLAYMRQAPEVAGPPVLRAVAVLSEAGLTDYHYFKNVAEIYNGPPGDGFVKTEKWAAMSGGLNVRTPEFGDESMLCGTGPYDLAVDGAMTVAFAVIGGTDDAGLAACARTARQRYAMLPLIGRPGDVNGDGSTDLLDILAMIAYMFGGNGAIDTVAADVNRSCTINMVDLVVLINYIYRNGPPPQPGCLP